MPIEEYAVQAKKEIEMQEDGKMLDSIAISAQFLFNKIEWRAIHFSGEKGPDMHRKLMEARGDLQRCLVKLKLVGEMMG